MLSPAMARFYRCKAAECLAEAELSKWPSIKAIWLEAAESWLALVRMSEGQRARPRATANEPWA